MCRDAAALHTTTFDIFMERAFRRKGFLILPEHYTKSGLCLAIRLDRIDLVGASIEDKAYEFFFIDGACLAAKLEELSGDSDWDLTRMHAHLAEHCKTREDSMSLINVAGKPRLLQMGNWIDFRRRLESAVEAP